MASFSYTYTLQNICYALKYIWSNKITCTDKSEDFSFTLKLFLMVISENILQILLTVLTVTVYCIFLSLFKYGVLIWSFKFYFSSYLQIDSSAYKLE